MLKELRKYDYILHIDNNRIKQFDKLCYINIKKIIN